ncbi:hypothetical protein D3C86_1853240 [compost metagenome]
MNDAQRCDSRLRCISTVAIAWLDSLRASRRQTPMPAIAAVINSSTENASVRRVPIFKWA